ncbi:MAG: response regulator transcription factor [Verrucomicrobia bacterium]|nr:response regulator transcription factor [Verrucomicrobiota bacterium]
MERLFQIEGQSAIRGMLAKILRLEPEYEVVGQTGDSQTAVDLCLAAGPDICILDEKVRGLNGVEVLRRTSRRLPQMRILVFSTFENPVLVRDMLEAGAHGFVEKTASVAEFRRGIDTVAKGGNYFRPGGASLLRNILANPASSSAADFLTDREREILKLVAESHRIKQIAARLGKSAKIVESLRSNFLRKLDLHGVASLTRHALEVGLIEPRATV